MRTLTDIFSYICARKKNCLDAGLICRIWNVESPLIFFQRFFMSYSMRMCLELSKQ